MTVNVSRRKFLQKSTLATAGLTATSITSLTSAEQFMPKEKSKVAIISDGTCVSGTTADQNKVNAMVDHAVMLLTGLKEKAKAYEALFPKPVTTSTTIAIKQNGISGVGSNKTFKNVVSALKTGLASMLGGTYPVKNITVTTKGSGTSSEKIQVGSKSYTLKKTWVDADYFINAPVCWAHGINGVTLGLKNTMSTVNGSLGGLHGLEKNSSTPWCSLFNSHPVFKDKLVLVILDALTGRSNGGPGGAPNFVENKIIASKDIIAVEYHGIEILKKHKIKSTSASKGTTVMKLGAQAKYGLGTDNPNNMEILTWDPTALDPQIGTKYTQKFDVLVKNYNSQFNFIVPENSKNNVLFLTIKDIKGRQIYTTHVNHGNTITWNGKNFLNKKVANGLYQYKLKIGNQLAAGKINFFN